MCVGYYLQNIIKAAPKITGMCLNTRHSLTFQKLVRHGNVSVLLVQRQRRHFIITRQLHDLVWGHLFDYYGCCSITPTFFSFPWFSSHLLLSFPLLSTALHFLYPLHFFPCSFHSTSPSFSDHSCPLPSSVSHFPPKATALECPAICSCSIWDISGWHSTVNI